jgi:Mg/Co/Ni transporter MgtE
VSATGFRRTGGRRAIVTDVHTTVVTGARSFDSLSTRQVMATETRSSTVVENPVKRIQVGLAGGLVAGVNMGVLLQFVLGVMPAIGALYTLGDPSLTVGWTAHVVHSLLFGALFAVLGGPALLDSSVDGALAGAMSGGLFATGLWAVNVVFVWPIWLNAVALGGGPRAP